MINTVMTVIIEAKKLCRTLFCRFVLSEGYKVKTEICFKEMYKTKRWIRTNHQVGGFLSFGESKNLSRVAVWCIQKRGPRSSLMMLLDRSDPAVAQYQCSAEGCYQRGDAPPTTGGSPYHLTQEYDTNPLYTSLRLTSTTCQWHTNHSNLVWALTPDGW